MNSQFLDWIKITTTQEWEFRTGVVPSRLEEPGDIFVTRI